jgi:putative phosphoesterase
MRLLVYSDVHANDTNISSVVKTGDYDRRIFAGDIFGYFTFDAAILSRLVDDTTDFVVGNHDVYFIRELYPSLFFERFGHLGDVMLTSDEYDTKYGTLGAARLAASTSRVDLRCLDEANTMKRIVVDGLDLLVCHGSPDNSFDGYIYPDHEHFNDLFRGHSFDMMILGHTHRPFIIERGGRYIVNPGSCTLPRGDEQPSYAIVETRPLNVQILRTKQNISFRKLSPTRVVAA